jgi:flavorubredoxin
MEGPRKVVEDIDILPSYYPIPGFGLVPINAFVLKAKEPVLVDTGLHQDRGEFIEALESVIDPTELRWIYLTHPDQDHVGSLQTLMDRLPHVRLITTFLGFGIISLFGQIALDRLHLLNPGQSLDLGDRTITVIKPPSFDNPATTGFTDSKTGALFSSDCFGALVQSPSDYADTMDANAVREGQMIWSTIDAPWLHKVDQKRFESELDAIRQLKPSIVLSSHLPPAKSLLESSLTNLADVPSAQPFVGPDQAALTAMLAQMTAGRPA